MTDDEQRNAQRAINRAQEARSILESALFNEAFEHIDDNIVNRWKSCDVHDIDERERAFSELRLVHAVRGYFQSALNDGKVAAEKLSLWERITKSKF